MKKYLVAAVMIVAFAGPAFAEDFYVAADLASGKCEMMSSMPDAKKYKMMASSLRRRKPRLHARHEGLQIAT